MWNVKSEKFPSLNFFLKGIVGAPPTILVQFILDPLMFDDIFSLWLYYLTRTFAYSIHRQKLVSLGRWPGVPPASEETACLNTNHSFVSGCPDVPQETHYQPCHLQVQSIFSNQLKSTKVQGHNHEILGFLLGYFNVTTIELS